LPQQVSNYRTGEDAHDGLHGDRVQQSVQQYYTESWYQTLMASYGFIETLKRTTTSPCRLRHAPGDPSDFSTDRRKALEAMQRAAHRGFLRIEPLRRPHRDGGPHERPGREKGDRADRSGRDTFSKLTFDKTRKILQNDAVPIYAIA